MKKLINNPVISTILQICTCIISLIILSFATQDANTVNAWRVSATIFSTITFLISFGELYLRVLNIKTEK